MEFHKIDLNSHLRNGWLTILGIIICANLSNIFSLLDPYRGPEDDPWIGAVAFMIFHLPAVIIHINYYLVNRGDMLEYSIDQKQITITHRHIPMSFHLSDIDFVEQSISYNQAAKRSSVLSWDGYNHSIIHLKNGYIFTVTSLLVQDLDLPIEEEKIKVKTNIFRLATIR